MEAADRAKSRRKSESSAYRRWLFRFVVAFFAALTLKDVFDLFDEFITDPKQADINIIFNETMTMPNITFCMGKNQAYSHFNLSLDKTWDKIIDVSKLSGYFSL